MTLHRITLIVLFLSLWAGVSQATSLSDTLYVDQSITGRATVSADGTIIAHSDTVKTTGYLLLVGHQGVTLQRDIDVQLGGTLIIRTGTPPRIRYTYDASGNRVRRERITQ